MNGSFNSEATTKLSSSIQHSKSLVGFSLALGLAFLFESYYNPDFRALSFHVPPVVAAIIVAFVGALGYGWGMKKFTKLVQQEKFLEQWKVDKPSVYNFYTTYKGVFFPPHNLFLEIAIQSGLLGLAAFIAFIGIYLFYLIKNTIRNGSDTGYNFSVILIGGTFLSFMIMNLMSNELGNTSGKILFVVLGAGAAWIKVKPR